MKQEILHIGSMSCTLVPCWFHVGPFWFSLQLLDFEARSAEQVPLLLKMKRSQLALSKAVESGDTDLGELSDPAPAWLQLEH